MIAFHITLVLNPPQFERQVIKVFGIYTHAQIDKRFWDSMGYQLCKKGKQYRERCKFRNKPFDAGDYVVAPASFPPVEIEEKDDIIVPELPREDLEEVRRHLSLAFFVLLLNPVPDSLAAGVSKCECPGYIIRSLFCSHTGWRSS
jgi:hypothetical protein